VSDDVSLRVLPVAVVIVMVLQAVIIAVLLFEHRRRAASAGATGDRGGRTHAPDAIAAAVMSSIGADVAVVDRHGVVLSTNGSWDAIAAEGLNPVVRATAGVALAAAMQREAVRGAGSVEMSIRSVTDGARVEAAADFSWHDTAGWHWSELRVRRLQRPEGGAVVAHQEVTARRRAEADIHRHLRELAHGNVMSGIGELGASIAHELNQPLTAILSNAQAGRRLIAASHPDTTEVRQIFEEIIEQDRRAGEVIQRMRRLLKKDDFDWAPVNVNAMAHDVIRLLSNQATLAGVTIVAELQPDLPVVHGDHLQLRQVILNLTLNAIQASAAAGRDARVWVITRADGDGVHLFVRDSGPGVDMSAIDRIFEPFYTTKADGLGIGLSISRSIVEVHQGRLTAANLDRRGAEFAVLLPVGSLRT
jgi:two-component system sensor kinase FixL